ncbi:PAS domain S-box protein [Ideonella sp. B7]|uniref:PAS domain-containing sensor histidine kinase n=1 Tax=Ideonella benzenivorans TaxID=2831643 RepID=UPI001CEC36C1|nr:PAS domain S-box protein [Ideonella benzenivorans]MCA6217948.1 PAS domain S-box protein [Ideonella benzenivorans]
MSINTKLPSTVRMPGEAHSEIGPAVPSMLADCLAISPLPLLLCDAQGRVQASNEPLRAAMGGRLESLAALPPALAELVGWPAQMPARGESRRREAWVAGEGGLLRHWRVTSRGVTGGAGRWLVQFEDLALEDARELAHIEISALMGTAGLGVATHDAARGWVTAAPPPPVESPAAVPQGPKPSQGQALLSVGRDVVAPGSLPDYERLQQALRQRQRTEVRYAVQHRDTGLRWLMTRVEPAELSGGRSALTVVTLDVTEEESARRHNDQLLHELGTILEVSPAGIAYLRRGALVRCNGRFEALLGLPAGGGTGLSLEQVLLRAGLDGTAAPQALQVLAQQGAFETEFQPGGEDDQRWRSLALRRAGAAGTDEVVAVVTDLSRLRRQQAELEELERERELMFNLSDVGIVYQREGRIERANQAMAELTGYAVEQLRGLALSELYEDDSVYLQYTAQERRELALQGRTHGERRLRRRDGSGLWVQVHQRMVDLADPAAGSITSFVNVDERRRVRETLLTQADRTRAILDSVLVGIVTVGEQGIEWMNRSARRMFGGELADFIGLPVSVVASSEPDHPLRRTDWLSTLEEGQAETFECRLTARDGRTFWVVGNVVVTGRENGLEGEAGQLTFALLDIERRREAENRIAQARAGLQRIIETAPLAIALFDAANQQVLQVNQTLCAFARRPAEAILGRQPALWLPGIEAASLSADLHLAVGSHETVRRELHRAEDPDTGQPAEVWDMRIVSVAEAGEAGGTQLLLVASDVTEQRAAEDARLAAAIAQREMLVKEVHHRIKNNLQGVAGLLQQNAQRHPEASAAIAEAVGHVHAIAQVHGLQVGMTGPLRVKAVMEAIAQSVQRMFGRPITMEVEGPDPQRFALTEADSIPVALTVNELLTNAIKHSAGGVIACRMVCEAGAVALCVANPGALAPGFELTQVPAGISGLGLVRALLPRKGAVISLAQEGPNVVARLRLAPPAVALLTPL